MGKKILIIDDEVKITEMLAKAFIRCGYDVVTANRPLEGLKIAREDSPDLIILDLIMPEIDGHKMCKLLKSDKDCQHIPIVMLSGSLDEKDREWAFKTGANAYLNKPFTIQDIFNLVEKFL